MTIQYSKSSHYCRDSSVGLRLVYDRTQTPNLAVHRQKYFLHSNFDEKSCFVVFFTRAQFLSDSLDRLRIPASDPRGLSVPTSAVGTDRLRIPASDPRGLFVPTSAVKRKSARVIQPTPTKTLNFECFYHSCLYLCLPFLMYVRYLQTAILSFEPTLCVCFFWDDSPI